MTAPRSATLMVALGSALAATCVAGILSSSLGGDRASVMLASVVVLLSAAPTLLPGILFGGTVPMGRWGMTAFVATMAQPLLAAGFGYGLQQTRELVRDAFWIGSLVGALIVLVSQVAWAVSVLSRAQRQWEDSRKVTEAV